MAFTDFRQDEGERLKQLLRGAITEYLDDMELEKFVQDLKDILSEEEESFLVKATIYRNAHEKLFKPTPEMSETTP
jgi:HEAT repeat protein